MNKLKASGAPADIQRIFRPLEDNPMYNAVWMTTKVDVFLENVQEYGEDKFWNQIRQCLRATPEEATTSLAGMQEEIPQEIQNFVSAFKRSVGLLKTVVKGDVLDQIDPSTGG